MVTTIAPPAPEEAPNPLSCSPPVGRLLREPEIRSWGQIGDIFLVGNLRRKAGRFPMMAADAGPVCQAASQIIYEVHWYDMSDISISHDENIDT